MDVFAIFADRVSAALKSLYPEVTEEALARLVVEPPRDISHGDLSSNAAMVAAKPLGKSPREVAMALAEAERGLKAFMFENVYRSEQVMAPVRRSQEVVSALFDAYMRGTAMPGRWAEAWRRSKDEAGRARVVCDFVAGMTDPYAIEQQAALFDAKARIG